MEHLSSYQPMSKAMEGLMGKERTCPNSCSHWSRGTFLPNCPTQTSSTSTDFKAWSTWSSSSSSCLAISVLGVREFDSTCQPRLVFPCLLVSVPSFLSFLYCCSFQAVLLFVSVLSFTFSFGSFVWFYSHKPPRRRRKQKRRRKELVLKVNHH